MKKILFILSILLIISLPVWAEDPTVTLPVNSQPLSGESSQTTTPSVDPSPNSPMIKEEEPSKEPSQGYQLEVKIPGSGLEGPVDLVKYINGIYKFAFAIIGLAAFGSLVFAGIMYLLAAGNIGEIGEAKSRIWSTLSGVLLALSIFLIFQTINPTLLKTKLPTVSKIVKCGTTDSAGKSIKGYCAELGKTCVDKYDPSDSVKDDKQSPLPEYNCVVKSSIHTGPSTATYNCLVDGVYSSGPVNFRSDCPSDTHASIISGTPEP